MRRDETIEKLKTHAEELRSRGVTRLCLFGSVLRNESTPDSDVDLLVDLDPDQRMSLIDFAELRLRLGDILGHEVDLVRRDGLKPYLKDAILAEARDVL